MIFMKGVLPLLVAAALSGGTFEALSESKHPFEQVNFVLLARRLEAFFRTV